MTESEALEKAETYESGAQLEEVVSVLAAALREAREKIALYDRF